MEFLDAFYSKLGDSIALGAKVRGIRGYLTQRDINSAVTAGERMDKNLLASKALAEGDEATIANIVTAETGVHPIKVVDNTPKEPQVLTLSEGSINAIVNGTAKATASLMKPAPTKRGRKRKAKP